MRQVVLDTETTGLEFTEGHRIIEIGCVELVNRRLTGNNFHAYINPQCSLDSQAQAVHGITQQFLADKPVFAEVAPLLWEYLQGAELIIHNATFDVGFLDHELSLLSAGYPRLAECYSIIDTLLLARELHPGQRNSLDALCKRYHIDNSQRKLHGALLDATLLANVYLAMTGGQIYLFDEEVARSTYDTQDASRAIPSSPTFNLPVLSASECERAAHEHLLASIRKKNGGVCVWDKLET